MKNYNRRKNKDAAEITVKPRHQDKFYNQLLSFQIIIKILKKKNSFICIYK